MKSESSHVSTIVVLSLILIFSTLVTSLNIVRPTIISTVVPKVVDSEENQEKMLQQEWPQFMGDSSFTHFSI